ncbi:Fe-S cluster assembly protein SufD [Xanthobacter autotrophicus]|uniref:Fe-S cluster assembly protein SufD n=1 Tax=Xanthobacter autotrophicus TaxID=280 RepID=UPI0024A6D9AA|nr:Fe-S cluster assembly protein SufD [Xanthobacter autotrophicus]MDI4656284.1 Fe-S cluster assembly protein SufD [Xanthobacter autotrophicus]
MNIPVRPARTPAEDAIAATLQARLAVAAGQGGLDGRMGELSADALEAFRAHGLPNRRVEEWKYTDLRAAVRAFPPLAGAPTAADEAEATRIALDVPHAARLLFVSGMLARGASDFAGLPAGVSALPLDAATAANDPLLDRIGSLPPDRYDGALALNTGFLGEGLVVKVEAGTKVAKPMHLAHVFPAGEAVAGFTRAVVVVGDGAELTLVESFTGREGVAYQANHAMELVVGDGATVNLVRLQEEGAAALHLGTLMVELGRAAKLDVFSLVQGAALSRHSVYGRFQGTGTNLGVRGATLLKGRQHADTTMFIDHAVAGCESRELFKTVLSDEAHGVFQGKIVVRRDAQKTDGRMMSQSLLLSDGAEMDNKPELEIFADDVQCGHGATVGTLDDKMLFYLRSRGLPLKEAERLLIQAFVGEAVEYVEDEALREVLIARMVAWLEKRAA